MKGHPYFSAVGGDDGGEEALDGVCGFPVGHFEDVAEGLGGCEVEMVVDKRGGEAQRSWLGDVWECAALGNEESESDEQGKQSRCTK